MASFGKMLTGLNCGSIWPDEMRWWGRLDEVVSSDSFHVIAPISAIWQWAIQAADPCIQPLALPLVLGALLLDRLRPYRRVCRDYVSCRSNEGFNFYNVFSGSAAAAELQTYRCHRMSPNVGCGIVALVLISGTIAHCIAEEISIIHHS